MGVRVYLQKVNGLLNSTIRHTPRGQRGQGSPRPECLHEVTVQTSCVKLRGQLKEHVHEEM